MTTSTDKPKIRAGRFAIPYSGPVPRLPRMQAESLVPFPASGRTLQNFVTNASRKITVNAAINPHSVAVKPFSFFRSRSKIPNIPSPITAVFGETGSELRLERLMHG
jgi:hypothetical protein